MDNITITTAAALRSRSESPFVLPTGANASWQASVPVPVIATGVSGSTHGLGFYDVMLTAVEPTPMDGTDVRVATKQTRPPRGVPR